MVQYDYVTKVYYKDIDQMGVVYYARYFEFFEQARTELLNDLGIIVTDIEDKGYFLPVVSATCDYKEGAKFEDEIIVRTLIKEVPRARMRIEYEVYRKADDIRSSAFLYTSYSIRIRARGTSLIKVRTMISSSNLAPSL